MPTKTLESKSNKSKRKTATAKKGASKASTSDFNIVDAVKKDHEVLKKFIEIMKDEDAEYSEKEEAYSQFSVLLKSHAPSEETALYKKCIREDDLSVQTNEAFVEHQIATLLMEAIESTKDRDRKEAQIKVLAESVEHHIEEEENEFLPDVEKDFTEEERLEMGKQFLSLRKKSQTKYSEGNAGVLEANLH